MRRLHGITVIAATAGLMSLQAWSADPQLAKVSMPWDLQSIAKTPKTHPCQDRPVKGMKSFFYEGADYKGKPTWVFAYYAAPEGQAPAGGWPAVVCAHGGGGTAYSAWVKYWNQRGYAAISMDLEGHLPGTRWFQVEGNYPAGASHTNAGPSRIDWFGDRGLPDREKWFYHAVADVIRANSLLRSFPEINPNKIGLTGISWGATVVSTVAGLDPRFIFVVPVYGCGFIHESDNEGLSQWFPPKNMTQEQFTDYKTRWDPSTYLPRAKMPMLWVTGLDDPVFQINILTHSARITGGRSTLCIRSWLIHGHGYGWEEAWEIYNFADSIVKGGKPLPVVGKPAADSATGLVHVKCTGEIVSATLYHTSAGGTWKSRRWGNMPCDVGKGEVVSRNRLPEGTKAYFVNVLDKANNLVTTDLTELK